MPDKGQESFEHKGLGQQPTREKPFVPGRAKPGTAPEGYHWVERRGLDPTKPPGYISGHELEKIYPTPQGEVTLPPEKEHLRGKLIEQTDFLDRVGTERSGGTPGSTTEREAEEQAAVNANPTQTAAQIPYVRGNYTADTDLEDQEREDELREQAVQQAISASRKGSPEEPPSKA